MGLWPRGDNYSKQQVGSAAEGLFVLWHLSAG